MDVSNSSSLLCVMLINLLGALLLATFLVNTENFDVSVIGYDTERSS
jgi:hypothetical protein